MSAQPLFACDLDNIETMLEMIGDREIVRHSDGTFGIAGAQSEHPLATELFASMRPFLAHAYFAAAQWKGKPPSWPYAHDACGTWRIMTNQRSKTKCGCGLEPHGWRKIEIRWAGANHHGRPDAQHFQREISDSGFRRRPRRPAPRA